MDFRGIQTDPGSKLVSVLVASFNNSAYVVETLESIRFQSYAPIELIIIDDCSKDGAEVLISDWIKENNLHVNFRIRERNKGICKGLNDMLSIATGCYITTSATDDLMHPDRIKILVDKMKFCPKEVGVLYHDVTYIGEIDLGLKSHFSKPGFIPLRGNLFEEMVINGFRFPSPSNFYKTEVFDKVGNYDERLGGEDIDMWFRIASKFEYDFVAQPLVQYRIHASSLSRNPVKVKIAKDKFYYYLKHVNSNNPKIARNSRNSVIASLHSLYKGRNSDLSKFSKMALREFYEIRLFIYWWLAFFIKNKNN